MKLDLSDRFVAKCKPGDYFDSKVSGLHMRVLASGIRSWCLAFTVPKSDGKRTRMTFGRYPMIGLARARSLAMEASAKLDEGIDPRHEAETRGEMTVADLAENYLKRRVAGLKSAAEIERRLRTDVLPLIGKIRLADLHRRDAHRVVDAMQDRGANAGALRTLTDLRAMVRWAVGRGDLEHDPLAMMQAPDKLPPRERVLSDDEIKTLWKELPKVFPQSTALALKLALATGQRIGEVAGISVEEIDLKRRLWVIPGARTKNKHEHKVPLSGLALELIAEARRDGDRIFGNESTLHIASLVVRNRDEVTVEGWSSHDLRRTALSGMAALGVSPHVLGHVANHRGTTKASVTLTVYVQHDYENEKRQALELWADRLQAIIAGGAGKVVMLRGAR
jgi:integrase